MPLPRQLSLSRKAQLTLLLGVQQLRALEFGGGGDRGGGTGVGLTFVPGSLRCIVNQSSPGSSGNIYGYEDGSVVRIGDALHMFVSEEISAPKWVGMRLGHWATNSTTGDEGWARIGTLVLDGKDMVSTKNCDGKDHMAALWSPMAYFVETEQRWYVTFVGYACPGNVDGVIYVARSTVVGRTGIGGPFESAGDGDPLLSRNQSVPWEGAQGDDSFVVFTQPGAGAGAQLLGIYGSSDGASYWSVGLATQADGVITGPWTRAATGNPLQLNGQRAENPIVFQVTPDPSQPPLVAAVHDWITREGEGFGITWSADGITWAPSQIVSVPGGVRAPMGVVAIGNDTVVIFFNRQDPGFDSLWTARFAVGPASPLPPPIPNGTPLVMRPCSNESAAVQRFVLGDAYGTLRLAADNTRCVDLLNCDTGAGVMDLWSCHEAGDTCGGAFPSSPAANQLFTVNANGTISYTHDVRYCINATVDGLVRLLPCAAGGAAGPQHWQLLADGAFAFRIQQQATDACVDVGF